jgi:hypothetical protein
MLRQSPCLTVGGLDQQQHKFRQQQRQDRLQAGLSTNMGVHRRHYPINDQLAHPGLRCRKQRSHQGAGGHS